MEPVVAQEDGNSRKQVSRRTFRVGCAAVLLVAAIVRIWGLDQVPPGLFCDEAGNGYNAFSLLESGRDEEGKFLPLYVWSFGVSYKNPVFIYSAIPVVGLFGLSEFTVRLTAALWGVLGVAAIVWLGTLLFGRRGGLWSGFFLALCPWHVHFSRVAFELIAVLPLFLIGFACFVKAVRGRPQWLVPAALAFTASLYAYAPAKMFVPLFLFGAAILYARPLIAAWRWTLAGALAAIVTGVPLLLFDIAHRDRSGQYFAETTILRESRSSLDNLGQVAANWTTFFTRDFLLSFGDPIVRHSVPEVGQIFFAMAPLIVLGLIWSAAPRRPEGKLLLWWLLLYPLAPSLMNEVPSASRGFIGVGALCLLAAAGAELVARLGTGGGARSWRRSVSDLLLCLVAATALFEAGRFGIRYVKDYPAAAAEAFQYGYREVLQAMEPKRGEYDRLMLTTTDGNQPQIFALFYNRYPPGKWLESFDPGYLIIDPADFNRYDPAEEKILAALRERDLALFERVTVKDRVYDPSGRQIYVIAEIEERGRYLREWLMLGPFDNSKGQAIHAAYAAPDDLSLDAHSVDGRDSYWRRIVPQFVRVELHHFYRPWIESSGAEPKWVCAYAATELVAENALKVRLELDGTLQWIEGWLNGKPLEKRATQLGARPLVLPLSLVRGGNQLLLKTCRASPDWSFSARLRGNNGDIVPGVRAFPRIASGADAAPARPLPEQVVSGFSKIVSFSHYLPGDSDYRGGADGWVQHLYDSNGAVEWETAPAPRKAATAFVFTAMVSRLAGRAHLWVDGKFALEFETGRLLQPREWRGNGYALRFLPRERGDYHSGAWVLYVPEAYVEAGKPLLIRVSQLGGHHDSSFMIKARSDTAEFETLTLDTLREDL